LASRSRCRRTRPSFAGTPVRRIALPTLLQVPSPPTATILRKPRRTPPRRGGPRPGPCVRPCSRRGAEARPWRTGPRTALPGPCRVRVEHDVDGLVHAGRGRRETARATASTAIEQLQPFRIHCSGTGSRRLGEDEVAVERAVVEDDAALLVLVLALVALEEDARQVRARVVLLERLVEVRDGLQECSYTVISRAGAPRPSPSRSSALLAEELDSTSSIQWAGASARSRARGPPSSSSPPAREHRDWGSLPSRTSGGTITGRPPRRTPPPRSRRSRR